MRIHTRQSTPVAEPTRFRSKFNVPLGIEARGFCALPGLHPESPAHPA
jgi:hypothetical protein